MHRPDIESQILTPSAAACGCCGRKLPRVPARGHASSALLTSSKVADVNERPGDRVHKVGGDVPGRGVNSPSGARCCGQGRPTEARCETVLGLAFSRAPGCNGIAHSMANDPRLPRHALGARDDLFVPLLAADGLPVEHQAVAGTLNGDHRRVPDLGDRRRREGGSAVARELRSSAAPAVVSSQVPASQRARRWAIPESRATISRSRSGRRRSRSIRPGSNAHTIKAS
jgi:hypothetical protein